MNGRLLFGCVRRALTQNCAPARIFVFLLSAALMVSSGCAIQRAHDRAAHAPTPKTPIGAGEILFACATCWADPPGFEVPVDSNGDVLLFLGKRVHLEGLTLEEADAAIEKLYVPEYYKDWSYKLVRIPHTAGVAEKE